MESRELHKPITFQVYKTKIVFNECEGLFSSKRNEVSRFHIKPSF